MCIYIYTYLYMYRCASICLNPWVTKILCLIVVINDVIVDFLVLVIALMVMGISAITEMKPKSMEWVAFRQTYQLIALHLIRISWEKMCKLWILQQTMLMIGGDPQSSSIFGGMNAHSDMSKFQDLGEQVLVRFFIVNQPTFDTQF